MLQIIRAVIAEEFQLAWQLRAEMGRWDAAESQRLGLDPQEVLASFYPTDDRVMLRENVRPDGELLLATYADNAAGCAAFRRFDASTCELHHVYVRDHFRGMRIGRFMVEQLVARATDAGYRAMRLETTTFMMEARALYTSIGFKPRSPYHAVPKAFERLTVFMELPLGAAGLR
jgi:GNAT superfamily N-acetyltransferase